jgi:hypothetical protein
MIHGKGAKVLGCRPLHMLRSIRSCSVMGNVKFGCCGGQVSSALQHVQL